MSFDWVRLVIDAALVLLGWYVTYLHQNSKHAANDVRNQARVTGLEEQVEIKLEAINKALTDEIMARQKADEETRQVATTAIQHATTLNDRLLTEINDELRRLRHDVTNMRDLSVKSIEQIARMDGRREAFEEMVKQVIGQKLAG